MRRSTQPYIDRLKLLGGLARAKAHKLVGGAGIAPGKLDVDPAALEDDQFLLLKKSRALGPIFKVWWNGKLTTCVMGIQGGMRFLAAHGKYMRAATINMRPIFPFGFLREMEGAAHAHYRRLIQAAFRTTPAEATEDDFSEVIRRRLRALAAGGEVGRNDIGNALMALATELMLRAVLGLGSGDPRYDALVALYETYAPNGMPLTLRSRHRKIYAQMRAHLLAHANDADAVLPSSLLSAVVKAGQLDDTIVGNLIHIVQFARYDMKGLWHWILLDASGQPEYLEQIGLQAAGRRELSTAFVSETLRMQQSEYIYRHVTRTFEHEGMLFLKGTRARVCVWEAHRDPQHFPDPDVFKPRRFLEATIPKGAYSPFGLDHHRCLGAPWVTHMSALFLECVADELVLARGSYGTPHRGPFHFEPGLDSEISLSLRGLH